MTVSDGDIIKCVVFITGPDNVIMNNVYHYQLSDPNTVNPTDLQVVQAVDADMSAIYGHWDDEMSSDYNVDRVEVDRVQWNATDQIWEVVEYIGQSILDIDGLGISDGAPHGCAANITLGTTDPKRRGRKFLPGIAEDGVTHSTFIGAVQTVLTAIAAELLTDQVVAGTADLVMGIPTNLGTWLPFIVAVANTVSAYQRRRKPGVGT